MELFYFFVWDYDVSLHHARVKLWSPTKPSSHHGSVGSTARSSRLALNLVPLYAERVTKWCRTGKNSISGWLHREKFWNWKDTFNELLGYPSKWTLFNTGILTMISRAIVIKYCCEMCQCTRISQWLAETSRLICRRNFLSAQKIRFCFLSNWMEYGPGDSFPLDFEPNGIPFGSKFKGKLSPRSYPIQCERKWRYSFLSARR